jgi:hypothetical protein
MAGAAAGNRHHQRFGVGTGSRCYARVYVDGRSVCSGRLDEPLFDMRSIQPAEIEGIEYYAGPAQTPMEYSTMESSCGVVVIWTRRFPDGPASP